MKYCTKCGKPVNDGEAFCGNCGAALNQVKQTEQVLQNAENSNMETMQSTASNQMSQKTSQPNMFKIIIVLLVCVIVLLLLILAKGAFSSKEKEADNQEVLTEMEENEGKDEEVEETEEKGILSFENQVKGLINTLCESPHYVASTADQAVLDDLDGDGIYELMLTYKTDEYAIKYELWRIGEKGNELLEADELYREVGGNSGQIGVVIYEDQPYFAKTVSNSDGDGSVRMETWTPWGNGGELALNGSRYFEKRINANDSRYNRYIIGDVDVTEQEYDNSITEGIWRYKIDPFVEPGNGDVMTFESVLRLAEVLED